MRNNNTSSSARMAVSFAEGPSRRSRSSSSCIVAVPAAKGVVVTSMDRAADWNTGNQVINQGRCHFLPSQMK